MGVHFINSLINKEKIMTKLHFGHLYPSSLGFDRLFNELDSMLNTTLDHTQEKFPPHNIIKIDDEKYIVELAVAGFDEDEIDITVKDGVLSIEGAKKETKEEVNYLHKGIGTRAFKKTLKLVDTIEVHGAQYKNGILRVGLENVIPEEKKPRKVEINSKKNVSFFKQELLSESK